MDHNSWILLHQVSKMNTAGVEAFATGNKELAIQHLNVAIVTINKLLLVHCDEYDMASHILRSQGGDPSTACAGRDDISEYPKTRDIECLKDDKFYIFNKALLFSAPANGAGSTFTNQDFDTTRTNYIQVSVFWSIVHFNMALVLHWLIHESHENNERYREEAILFYKLCLQNLWVIPGKSSVMNLLMLCAVNNFAHVYLGFHSSAGLPASSKNGVMPLVTCGVPSSEADSSQAMTPFQQSELIQGLLLRSIGKVIANEHFLTAEQQQQVKEMSVTL
jgi:hypothetical protein